MRLLQKSGMSKASGTTDAFVRQLIADVRSAVAISEHCQSSAAKPVTYGEPNPTQANLVSGWPYVDLTSSTHLGTASSEKAMCFFFHAS